VTGGRRLYDTHGCRDDLMADIVPVEDSDGEMSHDIQILY
jgi:hypothetical protein